MHYSDTPEFKSCYAAYRAVACALPVRENAVAFLGDKALHCQWDNLRHALETNVHVPYRLREIRETAEVVQNAADLGGDVLATALREFDATLRTLSETRDD